MKRNDIAKLVLVAVFAGVIAMVLAGAVFGSGRKPAAVPVVTPISPAFPDVRNQPEYKAVFNDNALDPTQLIQIGNPNNNTPFNGPQQ